MFAIKKWLVLAGMVLALIIIGIIIYITFFKGKINNNSGDNGAKVEEKLPPSKLNTNVTQETSTTTIAYTPTSTPEERMTADANAVAKNFVERYGTYSNQSGRVRIDDLSLNVTAKMLQWLKADYDEKSKNNNYNQYNSVTTKVITVKIVDQNQGQTDILADAQRIEDNGSDKKITKQKIKLILVKIGKFWKVDSAYWQ